MHSFSYTHFPLLLFPRSPTLSFNLPTLSSFSSSLTLPCPSTSQHSLPSPPLSPYSVLQPPNTLLLLLLLSHLTLFLQPLNTLFLLLLLSHLTLSFNPSKLSSSSFSPYLTLPCPSTPLNSLPPPSPPHISPYLVLQIL
jgi:hypothetical protein